VFTNGIVTFSAIGAVVAMCVVIGGCRSKPASGTARGGTAATLSVAPSAWSLPPPTWSKGTRYFTGQPRPQRLTGDKARRLIDRVPAGQARFLVADLELLNTEVPEDLDRDPVYRRSFAGMLALIDRTTGDDLAFRVSGFGGRAHGACDPGTAVQEAEAWKLVDEVPILENEMSARVKPARVIHVEILWDSCERSWGDVLVLALVDDQGRRSIRRSTQRVPFDEGEPLLEDLKVIPLL